MFFPGATIRIYETVFHDFFLSWEAVNGPAGLKILKYAMTILFREAVFEGAKCPSRAGSSINMERQGALSRVETIQRAPFVVSRRKNVTAMDSIVQLFTEARLCNFCPNDKFCVWSEEKHVKFSVENIQQFPFKIYVLSINFATLNCSYVLLSGEQQFEESKRFCRLFNTHPPFVTRS